MDFVNERIKSLKTDYEHCGFKIVTNEISIETIMLPMRDGKKLRTVIYKPLGFDKIPVIVRRTCYPNDEVLVQIDAENMAKRGYCFIYQLCRGTGGSEGRWVPNINERNDGIDTINWIYRQEWCENIGYWGQSYSALTGWAFADEVKDKVTSMLLVHYGTDRFISAYHKGLFHHDVLTGWSMQNAGWKIDAAYEESCRYMPQIRVDEDMWGGKLPWYRDYITNEYFEDDYWQQGWWKTLREIPEKVEIPLYIISGWYDHHNESTMKTWERLNAKAKNMSWLEIGGWNHGLLPVLENKKIDNFNNVEVIKALQWFQKTLKNKEIPSEKIKYYIPGKDYWVETDSWENTDRKWMTLYLNHSRGLADEISEETEEIKYTYNPDNPVMTHGGDCTLRSWTSTGSLLQKESNWRADVISFVSQPLDKDIIINGKIDVLLWVKTDCKNTAFIAHLDEVTSEGKAYHIRTSGTTIRHELPRNEKYTPGTPIRVIADMSDICYAILKGSRIRIDITSSDFPQYSVHSNQEGNWAVATDNKIAEQTILVGKQYPSCVKIPYLNV